MNKSNRWMSTSVWSASLLLFTITAAGCSAGAHSASDSVSSGSSSAPRTEHVSVNKSNETDKSQPSSDDSAATTGKGVTLIGDSVTVGIEPYLKEELPEITVDGKVGRQMRQAKQVIDELSSQGNLGQHVIIELGTNGPFNEDQLRSVLQSLADRKQVILMTTRVPKGWQDQVNETIKKVAPEFSNTTVVDWYEESTGKDEYFYPDGVHLKPSGSKYYASLLIHAMQSSH